MNKYLIIVLAVCMAALAISVKSCLNIKSDRKRLSDNQKSLFEQTKYYRSKDSLSAASVERLTLTKKELEQNCVDMAAVIDGLNIKLKRVQSASETGTRTEYIINTQIKDSLVFRDRTDTLRCIEFHDPYLTLSGCIDRSRFSGRIVSRDTLVQVIHRVPHKWWFIRWGTKAIRQDVISKNPHSNITYTEYIELKK